MFYYIVSSIALIFFTVLVFYVITLVRSFQKVLNNILKEQEFINGIIFRTNNAIENFENTITAVEGLVEVGKEIKDFWVNKKKDKKS